MNRISGFFVCRKLDHKANQKHSSDEVSAAIRRLKMRHPTAFLTEQDNAHITDLFGEESADQSTTEDESNWAGHAEGS